MTISPCRPKRRAPEVISFLPVQAVDPIYLDRSYYVEPERQGAKPYRLLRDALREKGRVAVAKVTLRDRQIVAVLRVHTDVLVLATMLWPDEVREPQFPFQADEDEWSTPTQELAMAEALIDSLSDEQLDPGRYRDVHRETLTALIDAKATGRIPTQQGEPGAVPLDLISLREPASRPRSNAGQRETVGGGAPPKVPAQRRKSPPSRHRSDAKRARRRSELTQIQRKAGDTPTAIPSSARCSWYNDGMSSCVDCDRDVDHCHGTLVVHSDRTVECTHAACELGDLLRHVFIIDCAAVLGGCRGREGGGPGGRVLTRFGLSGNRHIRLSRNDCAVDRTRAGRHRS